MKQYLAHKEHLEGSITYNVLGFAEKGHKLAKPFNGLVQRGIVHVVEFDKVPTIDNMDLNPVRLKVDRVNGQGRTRYAPEVASFEVTPAYLALLQNVAQYAGVDPSNVGSLNFAKIQEGLRQSVS
mgnify:FL=1